MYGRTYIRIRLPSSALYLVLLVHLLTTPDMVITYFVWSTVPHKLLLIVIDSSPYKFTCTTIQSIYRVVPNPRNWITFFVEAPSAVWPVTSYTMALSNLSNSPSVVCILPSISAFCCLGEIIQFMCSPFHIRQTQGDTIDTHALYVCLSGWR